METLRSASQTLERYIKDLDDIDEETVLNTLEELETIDVSIDLLNTTKIGRTISKLAKDKKSEDVASTAKQLESKWKALVTDAADKRKREESSGEEPTPTKRKIKSEKESTKKGKRQSSEHKKTPKSKKSEKNEKPSPKVKNEKIEKSEIKEDYSKNEENSINETEPGVIPVPVKDFKGSTNNPGRNTVQVKLWQALGSCQVVGGTESSKTAISIEAALFKKYGDTKNKEYQQKFRSLFSNLKDELNSGLRNALFTGDLGSERLIEMSYEELANPKLQKQRQELKEFQQEARRGDRHMREATCTMFTCNKCGKNQTTYFQLQTRSADEPMTTFVTCCGCGNHWKFS